MKFNFLEEKSLALKPDEIAKVVATLFGNDINVDSVLITKLRLFLCVLKRYSVNGVEGLSEIFDKNFFCSDFVSDSEKCAGRKYDVVIGNPPYVEDSKTQLSHRNRYGNIYANVLSSDLEQRAGRIIRQGNENKKVKIFRYVTESTFDGYLWVRREVA